MLAGVMPSSSGPFSIDGVCCAGESVVDDSISSSVAPKPNIDCFCSSQKSFASCSVLPMKKPAAATPRARTLIPTAGVRAATMKPILASSSWRRSKSPNSKRLTITDLPSGFLRGIHSPQAFQILGYYLFDGNHVPRLTCTYRRLCLST